MQFMDKIKLSLFMELSKNAKIKCISDVMTDCLENLKILDFSFVFWLSFSTSAMKRLSKIASPSKWAVHSSTKLSSSMFSGVETVELSFAKISYKEVSYMQFLKSSFVMLKLD